MSEEISNTPKVGFSKRYVIALGVIVATSFAPWVVWGPLLLFVTALFIALGVSILNRWYLAAGSLFLAVLATGLMLPAHYSATGASRRIACNSNMRDIWDAVDAYHSQYRQLPPPYTVDAQGNPLHSWRVLILPFLGEQELYEAIDLDKPWYDPANLPLGNRMPGVFACPEHRHHEEGSPTMTTYVAVVGDRTLWPRGGGRTLDDVTDEPADTLLLIESKSSHLHWMSTADPEYERLLPVDSLGQNILTNNSHYGGYHVVVADGRTGFLPDNLAFEDVKLMLVIDDGPRPDE